ncbi:ABC transporter ATP-binding protein [Pectobacterium cacticida]|uniref:ABC transporter ATP-binding protein n=1 Tax=Pectobacterium cacticida TaxID=69221 RepID=A0ABZ2GBW2_9GAMM|nr:ABC transporter ATP-binding protein [Pectobacterium cacticida]UYX06938.1 ABC transporter ATP-binding protein [Pectobacterium cacticida]
MTHVLPMLSCRHLHWQIQGHTIIQDLSLDLPAGAVYCIVGPSGSGKSSLLRLIAGLDNPQRGKIFIDQHMMTDGSHSVPPEKRRLNMVFQDYALWPHMTVKEIVGYGLHAWPTARRQARVKEMLALMQIDDYAQRRPAQLSGGQAQRVAIARALATDPQVLLFDEPLSNLDVQLRAQMRNEFSQLFSRLKKTVVYVTHDPLEACAFADRIVVMRAGNIEQIATPVGLFQHPESPWVASLAGFDSEVEARLVMQIDNHHARVEMGSAQFIARIGRLRSARPGQQIRLLFNPGAIHHDASAPSGLAARVVSTLFEGRHWRLNVATTIGDIAFSIVHPTDLPVGSPLSLVMTGENCLIFDHDRPSYEVK